MISYQQQTKSSSLLPVLVDEPVEHLDVLGLRLDGVGVDDLGPGVELVGALSKDIRRCLFDGERIMETRAGREKRRVSL